MLGRSIAETDFVNKLMKTFNERNIDLRIMYSLQCHKKGSRWCLKRKTI